MRSTSGIAVLTIVVLFAALAASADIVTSSLTGRVTAGEQAVAGVRVTATSTASPFSRTTTTNAEGRYFLDALPPGRYDVAFELSGHQSVIRPAIVELGRVARADARLEPSEDEETVTSTAITRSVVDTTAIASHFSREDLDRLPLYSGPGSAGAYVPATDGRTLLDGTPINAPLHAYEIADQATVIRAAAPAFVDAPGAVALRTRSGGETWSFALRDTWYESRISSGHLHEATAEGRIVPGRLWFFGAGWKGDHQNANDTDGVFLKLTARGGTAHDFGISWFDADRAAFTSQSATTTQLRYSGAFGQNIVVEALASRQSQVTSFIDGDEHEASLRLSWSLGSHLLSGGFAHDVRDDRFSEIGGRRDYDETTLIVSDRWQWRGLALDAGLRHTGDHTSPRIALMYDLRGNGRQAIAASYGEYAAPATSRMLEVSALGFLTAVGSGGSARIDAIRSRGYGMTFDQLQFESRYRLFDRFEFGAVYSRQDGEGDAFHTGRVWTGGQFAIGSQELGLTVAESHAYGDWGTDVALRYVIPISRVALTLGSDAFDLFGDRRLVRLWARVRL